ncbi:MAG: diacylglycerol kinase family lipid kinase [Anaerolineaceae bacterium]|nr:diacylglycerol kinase family lipid kinase [Anaerolineaceae bacterium]
MKATLIYNTGAGQANSLTPEDILEGLKNAGFSPVYLATKNEDDLDEILHGIDGLVVSAGGDGTAKAVATRLVGNPDAAMTILPMGTANNLNATLGVEGTPLEIIERLRNPQKHRFDLGHVSAPWGDDYFMEGAGLGFFAEVLARYEPEKGKSVTRSVKSLVEVLTQGYGQRTTVHLPQQDVTCEFLLVEILNAHAVGPRLKFAPDADPTDGLLHVVCIDGEKREGYFSYLRGLLTEEMVELPSVSVYRVPELSIEWHGFPFHIDDYVQPKGFNFRRENQEEAANLIRMFPDVPEEATIHVKVLPQALNIWLPEQLEGKEYSHAN